ncbi:MAG TPA: glycosyltransferase family 2 protein [Longimicrobiales bacterium]|nr:glycosyltransferase family 2 protein [Longimicrobiales bacterium]
MHNPSPTTAPDARAADTPVAEGVTVVVPAYNEERGIAPTLREIRSVMEEMDRPWEILVVDDGSTDATAAVAAGEGARVVRVSENRGYGAALKRGFAGATYDLGVIIDADGTYPATAIPALLEHAGDYDMVVGARTGEDVNVPAARRPAKWFLGKLASYLAGRPIPDLNSGLRVIRRDLVERYEHVLPSGFSFTTTITLAALCNEGLVHYHPIDYRVRVGESKIRPGHAFDFLMLILRTVVYFNPLKVFLPAGAVLFLIGFGKFLWDLFLVGDFSDTVVMGFLGAVLVWSVGLLSDQIARTGLAPRRR